MAFGKAQASVDAVEVKRFIGVAPVFVKAVNPTKKELEALYDRTIENDVEYTGTQEVDGKQIPTVRFDFIIQTDESLCGVNLMSKVSYFVRQEPRYNRDKSKVQIIDKYGRTAWVTIEQAKNHEIPMYSNGPANIDKDYRACFVGEEDLLNFVKTYLNIPNCMKYVDGKWIMIQNPEDAECRFEDVKKWFIGDYSEVKNAIAMMPNNKVKVLFGVRSTDEGKQYQAVYTQMILKPSISNYDKLKKDLTDRKAAGAYPTTEFETVNIKEYKVEATDFGKVESNTTDNPFASTTASSPFDF